MYEHITTYVGLGKRLGHAIGFPTINLTVDNLALSSGTYKVNILLQEKKYSGLGPFFPDRKLFEVHILDFSTDLQLDK